jgi:hypothetical protein
VRGLNRVNGNRGDRGGWKGEERSARGGIIYISYMYTYIGEISDTGEFVVVQKQPAMI